MANYQLLLEIRNIGYGAKFCITDALNSRETTGRKLRQV